jgi:hypothetical protein
MKIMHSTSANLGILIGNSSSSGSLETGLLLLRRLGTVFVKKFEQLCSRILVKSMGELSNGGWNFETLVEDDFLALETNVFRPLDEASQVGLRTNVLA